MLCEITENNIISFSLSALHFPNGVTALHSNLSFPVNIIINKYEGQTVIQTLTVLDYSTRHRGNAKYLNCVQIGFGVLLVCTKANILYVLYQIYCCMRTY